jgi:hypothetical protein
MIGAFATELQVVQAAHLSGTSNTISYLSWGLDQPFGGGFGSLTLTLRKNSANSASSVSFGADTTGWMTDDTHSISVLDGDLLDFTANTGAGDASYSGDFFCASARFDAPDSTTSVQMLTTVGPGYFIPPSPAPPSNWNNYANILGILSSGNTTESDQQFKSLTAGTWRYMACSVQSNSLNQSVTITNRINGSDTGSMSISIASSHSGGFEDTTGNSNSVSSGDYLDYQLVSTASMGGILEMNWIGAQFFATDLGQCVIGGTPNSNDPNRVVADGITVYSSLFGGGDPGSTIPRGTGLIPYDLVASNFTNHLTDVSDPTSAATFSLLQNGTAALSTSSSPGMTGWWTDTDTASFNAGD